MSLISNSSAQQHRFLQPLSSQTSCLVLWRCSLSCSQRCRRNCRSRRLKLAASLDQAPAWTLDQIAGLAFGGILLASVLLGSKVDQIIARSQRRGLGLCEQCGGLNDPATCQENRCPMQKAVLNSQD